MRQVRFQMMETGEGKTPSWEDHLNAEQHKQLDSARTEANSARSYGNYGKALIIINAGLLFSGIPPLAALGLTCGAIMYALADNRKQKAQASIDDLRTTAQCNAAEGRRSPAPSRFAR